MQFIDVDLPAPFGPRRPKHSPLGISNEIPSTAHRGGPPGTRYSLRRFRTVNGGSARAISAGYHGHTSSPRCIIAALRDGKQSDCERKNAIGAHEYLNCLD